MSTIQHPILTSLPPLDQDEFDTVKSQLESLNISTEDADEVQKRLCQSDDPSSDTPLMAAVREKLVDARRKYTSKGLISRFTIEPADNGAMVLRTYVEQVETSNSRRGAWSACWQIRPDEETEAFVSGSALIHVHYSEEANVQLRAERSFEEERTGTNVEQVNAIVAQMEARTLSYEAKVAKAIVKHVGECEKKLCQQMLSLCDDSYAALKKLRRILPITKTRFKWDAAAQKQVRLLNDRQAT